MDSVDPRERDDLCGQELVSEELWEDLAEKYDPETWYKAEDGTDYCCRGVWDEADDGRCIWHADVAKKPAEALAEARSEGPARLDRAVLRESDLRNGVTLSECRLREADLGGANLMEADLGGAKLIEADLGGADFLAADLGGAELLGADLGGAELRAARLGDADLLGADLGGADLGSAGLSGARLRAADLGEADLGYAKLGGADLRGTDLTACSLHQTTFEDAMFDEATTFGASSGHETGADDAAEDASRFATHVSTRLSAFGRPSTDPEPLANAETQYRTIQRLRREHDLKQDPELEVQEKHARRKRALAEHRYFGWLYLAGQRHIIGYAEKSRPVVRTAVAVIVLSALVYPLFGLRVGKTGLNASTIGYPFDGVGLLTGLGKSVYFSVITFTTLGYGDIQPLGFGEAVATAESFVGALLMALLVYVLGRRATW